MYKFILLVALGLSIVSSSHAEEKTVPQGEYEEFRQFQEFKKMKKEKGAEPAHAQPDPSSSVIALTAEERRILDRGEISQGAYIGGGVAGTLLGLGIGHAVQGRYGEKGWIFTVGEMASATLFMVGAADCVADAVGTSISNSMGGPQATTRCNDGLLYIGAIGLLTFRIWELVDLWATPPEHNNRYRSLQQRATGKSLSFYLTPTSADLRGGLVFRF